MVDTKNYHEEAIASWKKLVDGIKTKKHFKMVLKNEGSFNLSANWQENYDACLEQFSSQK